jgi:hypothetical protein
MKYLEKIKRSLSLKNLAGKFDEEKIYGPLCILGEIIIIFLFTFNILTLNIFIMLTAIIAYIFFIYFPFHRKLITIFTFLIFGGFLAIIGSYALFSGKINFSEIKIFSILWWVFIAITFLMEYLASFKYKLEDIDIFFGYVKLKVGMWLNYLLFPLAFYAFVFIVGTYYLFGQSHVILWIPIFFFWIISIIRLFLYRVLR